MEIVRMFQPGAFITVEDVKSTSRGYFARRRNFSESPGRAHDEKEMISSPPPAAGPGSRPAIQYKYSVDYKHCMAFTWTVARTTRYHT